MNDSPASTWTKWSGSMWSSSEEPEEGRCTGQTKVTVNPGLLYQVVAWKSDMQKKECDHNKLGQSVQGKGEGYHLLMSLLTEKEESGQTIPSPTNQCQWVLQHWWLSSGRDEGELV